MNTKIEIDYEKQFQDDLVKATAISLEQHALDEYNRTRKYGSKLYSAPEKKCVSGNQLSMKTLQILPQQRRYSDVTHNVGLDATSSSTSTLEKERSKTPPPPTTTSNMDNDLISFSSPRSKNTDRSAFDKLIEDIQKLHTNKPQNTLIAASNGYNMSNICMKPSDITTSYTCSSGNQNLSSCSQIVAEPAANRIAPTFNVQPKKKKPLTNEELERLYSMMPSSSLPSSFIPKTNDLYRTCNVGYIPFIHTSTLQNHSASSHTGLLTKCNAITSTSTSPLANSNNQSNYLTLNSDINNFTSNYFHKRSLQHVSRKIKAGTDLIDLSQEDEYVHNIKQMYLLLKRYNNYF